MIVLRDYQIEGVLSLDHYFATSNGHPLLAAPTASGKAWIIAGFCKKTVMEYPHVRIMQLTHVKELVDQNFKKLITLWPQAPAGVYSAGLKRRDHQHNIIFAGIASVARKPQIFGHIDILVIDEAHLVSDKESSMYRKFIAALMKVNPNLKVIGLSATIYRLGLGMLTDGGLFTDVCFDYTTMEKFNRLIAQGWLCPLVGMPTEYKLDVSKVHVRGGEFVESELQAAVDRPEVTRRAIDEVIRLCGNRRRWLVFASGVHHCNEVAAELERRGVPTVVIHSKLTDAERDERYAAFRDGKVVAAVNNNILTTGVDVPEIDLIVVLRPTKSTPLWVQMLGRGTRVLYASGYDLSTSDGRLLAILRGPKPDCLVLDFARNTETLGPINDPVLPRKKGAGGGEAPVRTCPQCLKYVHASARVCPYCAFVFPLRVGFEEKAGTSAPMVYDPPVVERVVVRNVTFNPTKPRGRPPSLRVSYFTMDAVPRMFQEFVCFEHTGWARGRAEGWWRDRAPSHLPVPNTVAEAHALVKELRIPHALKVWVNKTPPEIMSHEYFAR